MKIVDIKKMPRFNAKASNGTDSVTHNKVSVYRQKNGIVVAGCNTHGAMLAVAVTDEGGTIFRCPTCNEGAYRPPRLSKRIKDKVTKWVHRVIIGKE